jgi:uncharacterized protein
MTTAAPASILGRPVWFELMTTDPHAAEAFYDKVIGWTSEPFDASPQPYTQFKRRGGVAVAGVMKKPDGMNMPSFWSMYVAVPKLDEAAADTKRLGGSELSEVIEVPTVGHMQMLKDPQGAAFYLIQPESHEQSSDQEPAVGDASWLELLTTDAAAAMKFYQTLFGWRPSEKFDMGAMGTYQMFNRGDRMIGGMMNKPSQMAQAPPHWAIYFRVPDINAATTRITANGGKILNGPTEVPGGDWVVTGSDPQGASFALHARKSK